jgi:hypothetical protein
MTLAGLTAAYARRVQWEARAHATATVTVLAEALGKGGGTAARASADSLLGQMGLKVQ